MEARSAFSSRSAFAAFDVAHDQRRAEIRDHVRQALRRDHDLTLVAPRLGKGRTRPEMAAHVEFDFARADIRRQYGILDADILDTIELVHGPGKDSQDV
jgi:hypothetical protein